MNEEPLEEPRARGRFRFGCLARILIAIAGAVALIIIIGETFDQGDSAKPPSREFDAGPAENYERGDLTEVAPQRLWIVRLEDGEFIALYNKSPKQQQLGSNCRVRYDESAQLIALPQLPGFSGAFVEECEGLTATWRADGRFAGGAGYGDLDRFETSVTDDGRLIVDTNSRTCTKSRGVPGLPPYDVQTCRGRPG
jgi:hypothetical protein